MWYVWLYAVIFILRALRELSAGARLAWIAARWSCSRQTVRRVLKDAGSDPLYLGSARNGTVRFAIDDMLAVEAKAQRTTAPRPGSHPAGR